MVTKKVGKIYYINRYDLRKINKIKDFSGYEQVVKYSSSFYKVDKSEFLYKILKKIFYKSLPKGYLAANLSKEIKVFFKVVFTKQPVFYLYADKDAFLLPLLKRKLKLKWIKIFGTLHWPPEESEDFSFYKFGLSSEFNGIIGLSSTIKSLNYKNIKIIPHGIDLSFWKKTNSFQKENLYLIVGISNRDHIKQKRIILKIKNIDSEAKFLIITRNKAIQKMYEGIEGVNIKKDFVADDELKTYYEKSKAVILFQNHCLASNVVLESMAMCVPIIANLVGDIHEYLGDNYPLYITDENEEIKLREFCISNTLIGVITARFEETRNQFNWLKIAEETVDFIQPKLI